MGETVLKAALGLFFVALLLAACSEEPELPDRGQTEAAPQRTVASGPGGVITSREGAARKLTIEEAKLVSAKESDQIFVQVAVRRSGFFPDCFLMDGPTKDALRSGDAVYSRTEIESRWADYDSTETVEMGYTYVIIFHEDPDPPREVADPRRTQYFVMCQEEGGVGDSDEAHVEGTPEAS